MANASRGAEIALSAAWHAGALSSPFTTVDGKSVEVVHRGAWTHGLGPDFRDALLLFDGHELRSGSVEVHRVTRGWKDHGHHLDPVYNSVILHVVGEHDGSETRRQDGGLVPAAAFGSVATLPVPDFAAWDWDRVGGRSCAEGMAVARPDAIKEVLFRLGDIRLGARSARIEARLETEPPGEILWGELLDGLGFSSNRQPMVALANAVPTDSLETLLQATATGSRLAVARGVLLGVAGFLPLSPTEAHLGRLAAGDVSTIESAWREWGGPWKEAGIPPTAWNRSRVRPANHPVPRLLAAARLAATASTRGGLLPAVLDLLLDAAEPVGPFRDLTGSPDAPGIGTDRAIDILASGVLPFALALAAHTGDPNLAEAAAGQWERLTAPAPNAVSTRALRQVAGSARLRKIGARGAQGLLHLDTTLCQPRRCFECPIASLALAVND